MPRQTALKLDEHEFDIQSVIKSGRELAPFYVSSLGALLSGDCMEVLPALKDNIVDTVFADPPFNLGKKYGCSFQDLKPEKEYVSWCKQWISECARLLKPGGAFFLYNLPKWNVLLGAYLAELGMEFRHWIAVEIFQHPYQFLAGFIQATIACFIIRKDIPLRSEESVHRYKSAATAVAK